MSHRIAQQPNGKYCIYSTVVDCFIYTEMSEQELKDYYIQKAIERETEEINEILDEIKSDSVKNSTLYEELLHNHNTYPQRNNT